MQFFHFSDSIDTFCLAFVFMAGSLFYLGTVYHNILPYFSFTRFKSNAALCISSGAHCQNDPLADATRS